MSLSSLMPFNFSSVSKAAPNGANPAPSDTEGGSDFSEELQQASASSSPSSSVLKKQLSSGDAVSETSEHAVKSSGEKLTSDDSVESAETVAKTADLELGQIDGELAAKDEAKAITSDQQVIDTDSNDAISDDVLQVEAVTSAQADNTKVSTVENIPPSQAKQQTMTEGEAFLNQMDAVNKQLSAKELNTPNQPSANDVDGNTLPVGTALVAGQSLGEAPANASIDGSIGTSVDSAELQGKTEAANTESLAHVFNPSAVNSNVTAANVGDASVTSSEAEAVVNGAASGATEASQAVAASGAIGVAATNNVNMATNGNSEPVNTDASDTTTEQVSGKASGAAVLASGATTSTPSASTAHIPWSSSAVMAPSTMDAGGVSSANLASGLAVGVSAGVSAGIGIGAETVTPTDGSSQEMDHAAAMLAGGAIVANTADGQQDPTANIQANESAVATTNNVTAGSLTMQQAAKADALAQAQTPIQLTKDHGGDELAEKVNIMLSKNLKHVDIRLDPPELGKVQIKLSMNQDQASVQFTAANAQTRELLEHSMPRLRELLHQQGMQLAQTSVQQDTSRQQSGGQAFAGQQGQHTNGQDGSNGGQQRGGTSGQGHGQGDGHWGAGDGQSLEMYATPSNDRVDYYA
ncbi:flagellar hook-length control protein FliK [Photobacterium sanguinicancri]|uniref:flagellar hook-length control protein FliK n=1 Tax=Photobacterium sanguinicancri TaxID=875932 RepID=UPI003D0DD926